MGVSEHDLSDAARVLLEELLKLRRGERLLVYVDRESDPLVADAVWARAEKLGARPERLALDTASGLDEPAQQLAERIGAGGFDAVCELSSRYFYRTAVAKRAREAGARVYWVPGLDAEAFVRCVAGVDHDRLYDFGLALREVLRRGRRLRVSSERGTHLRMRIGRSRAFRRIARLLRRGKPSIPRPQGLLDEVRRTTFLGGELAFSPIPESIAGRAVIDAQLWPPDDVGTLREPLVVTIRRGRVVDIGGCASSARTLNRWFEGRPVDVEHFCLGYHPAATLGGGMLEAERAVGCFTVGLGKDVLHSDGVVTRPSIQVDREGLLEEGSFVHPELVRRMPSLSARVRPGRRCGAPPPNDP